MLNALTIDVEDYYHVAVFAAIIRPEEWGQYESRVERNVHRLLDLLDEHQTRATFFVLGWVGERYPHLVRTIHMRGHEVACHGYAHQLIYTQTPQQFRRETQRSKCLLEDAIGQPVSGYRAASYSITQESLWALEILQDAGFRYDSSIFPIHHDRYGIPGASRFGYVVNGPNGASLVELPPSTVRLAGINIPIAGGGYFRILPYALTRWGISHINKKERQPAVVYLHPWEIDPGQPRIHAGAFARFRQYFHLDKTESRLVRLLQEFRFDTASAVLQSQGLFQDCAQDPGLS